MLLNNTIKISAAGSGKTWGICHDALNIIANSSETTKVLITTYTNKGVEAIETEIKKQNYGVLSKQIVVRSWYQFLLYELIRPYQTFITEINEVKSFDFSNMYGHVNYMTAGSKQRYINAHGNVRANQASEFAILLNTKSNRLVLDRLEKIYSHIFIDEIQDMAGNDLEIIDLLMDSKIATICVGDNKQATYKTHNTQKRKKESGKNIWSFFYESQNNGKATIEQNLVSRRFNDRICRFANYIFPNENNISTCMTDKTEHDGVFLIRHEDVPIYYDYFKPTVLKYDSKTETDSYASMNFGQCKGSTFNRIMIYPNGPLEDFIVKGKPLNSQHKYYVAVTRPRYSIAIVLDELSTSNHQFKAENICVNGIEISSMRFVAGEGD